jgi:hypothetical protein
MNIIVETLKNENIFDVKKLLKEDNLPFEDIDDHWKTFLVAIAEKK